MTQGFISAAKRGDKKGLIVEYLRATGHEDEAEQIEAASRITTPLIERVLVPLLNEDDGASSEDEGKSQPKEDVNEEVLNLFDKMENLVANGKYKKAKKAHKKLKKLGLTGDEMDRYADVIKKGLEDE
jgi:hypothetical protein